MRPRLVEPFQDNPVLPPGPEPAMMCDATVSYVDQAGTRHVCSLLEVGIADLEIAAPHRRFHAYRGQKHFPGLWWTATTRSHIGYESWLERYWLTELDHDPEVVHIASQPFVLTWPSLNRRGFTEHIPDYLAHTVEGRTVIVDCHRAERIIDEAAEKFAATLTACRMLGWSYLLLVEPVDIARYVNLRWLAGYRHPRFADPDVKYALLVALEQPRGLYAAADTAGDLIRTLPVLYHLLWRGELSCAHESVLTDRTVVHRALPGEVTGLTKGEKVLT